MQGHLHADYAYNTREQGIPMDTSPACIRVPLLLCGPPCTSLVDLPLGVIFERCSAAGRPVNRQPTSCENIERIGYMLSNNVRPSMAHLSCVLRSKAVC